MNKIYCVNCNNGSVYKISQETLDIFSNQTIDLDYLKEFCNNKGLNYNNMGLKYINIDEVVISRGQFLYKTDQLASLI